MMQTDLAIFVYLNQVFSGRTATFFFTYITYLGNGLVLLLLIVSTLYFLDRAGLRRHILAMILSVAASGAVVNIIKPIVNRPRPADYFKDTDVVVHVPIGTPPDKAFPSGHTQTAFGAAAYLSCMYPSLSPLFLGLAVLTGISRIAVGVHYPADVAVGALFGIAFSLVGFHIKRSRLQK